MTVVTAIISGVTGAGFDKAGFMAGFEAGFKAGHEAGHGAGFKAGFNTGRNNYPSFNNGRPLTGTYFGGYAA